MKCPHTFGNFLVLLVNFAVIVSKDEAFDEGHTVNKFTALDIVVMMFNAKENVVLIHQDKFLSYVIAFVSRWSMK